MVLKQQRNFLFWLTACFEIFMFNIFLYWEIKRNTYSFHFLWQMSFYLVGYAKRMLSSEQPIVLLTRIHVSTMLLTNLENLNFILNIFQETRDFLILTDPVIICIYLRTTNRHFRDQGNVRHLTSKLLKCDLVQTLNTFRNPSLRIFAAGKASLFFKVK